MLFCNHSVGNAWGRQDPKVGLETPSSSSALDLAPKGSLRKVTWRFPFTWTHPPRSKLLVVAEVFLGSGVAVLGKAEHKRDFRPCWAVLCLQCSWKEWWASFPLPHGLSVPAASCAGAGSVSQGDKGSLCAQGERLVQPCTEWCCSCSVPWASTPCASLKVRGAGRKLSLLGAAWGSGWVICVGNHPLALSWSCLQWPGLGRSQQVQVFEGQEQGLCLGASLLGASVLGMWFGRILLPGIAHWGDRLLEGGLGSVSFLTWMDSSLHLRLPTEVPELWVCTRLRVHPFKPCLFQLWIPWIQVSQGLRTRK